MLKGGQLAGGNSDFGRVENDFYATNPEAVKMLFDNFDINSDGVKNLLEPCVGTGMIADTMKEICPNAEIKCVDIIDRGYPNTFVGDFLITQLNQQFDMIITNPPYSLAQEFIEKSFDLTRQSGYIIMFLKIQFLESEKRKGFFEKFPPKYIYVFSNRMGCWRNGQRTNPNTGKKWQTTMCHAWFIWQKGFAGEPIIRWL